MFIKADRKICVIKSIIVIFMTVVTYASHASASDVMRWELENMKFDDGAIATGFIDIDFSDCGKQTIATNTCNKLEVVSWAITTSGGSMQGVGVTTYNPDNSKLRRADLNRIAIASTSLSSGHAPVRSLVLVLNMQEPISPAGGSVALAADSRECFDCSPARLMVSGNFRSEINRGLIFAVLGNKFYGSLSKLLTDRGDDDLFFRYRLPSAHPLDFDRFKNALTVANPDIGLMATLQEYFVLTDNPFPMDAENVSVLEEYEYAVKSSQCAIEFTRNGCRRREQALDYLESAKLDPSVFRRGGRQWRRVDAEPYDWAQDSASWQDMALSAGSLSLSVEFLHVSAEREWLSNRFIESGDWYVAGECAGFISDGIRGNNNPRSQTETLPQIPVGIVLTRKLSVTKEGQVVFEQPGIHLSGVVFKDMPKSPSLSDPSRTGCAQ